MAARRGGVGAVDLTRTVGWFTSLYPVRLDPGPLDLEEALSGGAALGRALKTIKEQLRAVPGKGLGYGLLRYLNGETARAACRSAGAAARLQLSGPVCGWRRWRGLGARTSLDEPARSEAGDARLSGGDPAMPLAHVIEINALTLDGTDGPRLTANWTLRCGAARRGRGARSGGDLVPGADGADPACRAAGCGGLSPSDVALVALTQGEIERLESHYGRIEDILPLSPLQEGLLFHALYDAQGPDVYTVQLELELEGALDAAPRLRPRCRRWSGGTPACGRASGMSSSAGPCRWCCRGSRCRGG